MRPEGKRWKTVVQETVDFCQPKMGFCQRHVQWDQHRLWPKFVPLALMPSLDGASAIASSSSVRSSWPGKKKIGPGPLKIGTWNPSSNHHNGIPNIQYWVLPSTFGRQIEHFFQDDVANICLTISEFPSVQSIQASTSTQIPEGWSSYPTCNGELGICSMVFLISNPPSIAWLNKNQAVQHWCHIQITPITSANHPTIPSIYWNMAIN